MAAFTGETKPERPGRRRTSPYAPASASGEAKQGSLDGSAGGTRPAREVLPPGTKVGRYEIIRLIGEGGMGTVYEAMDARLGRKVALKILSGGLKSKRKAAKRFAIEAQAAARLDHPNVVSIFDFDLAGDYPYMAMEYLQGETLAAEIARGPLSVERLTDIMLAVCAGVFAAHRAGIVHRDLKPSNIFLCRDWKGIKTARVLDFGISKVGGISSSELTQTGDIVGTSQYLSPEQAAGSRHVTELSDQFSLGVLMYEALTQQTPQRGQPIYNLLRNIIDGRHLPAHELRKDLPPAFEALIDRAMAVRPNERFASVLELARALFPFASPAGQRQFSDFCGPAKALAQSGSRLPAEQPSPAGPAATERLAAQAPVAWQHQSTRTDARPSARVRRTAGDSHRSTGRQAIEKGRPRASLGRMIFSVGLGALLAMAILLAIGLILRI